jgi:3-deoxy-manno-octulosonate cytidylyltransferase (CMP-KDO synthetase)
MNKTLGIIPARYASSRFPGKPLIDLKGKSMIQRVYEGVVASNVFDAVVVATDDQRILDHVELFGGNAIMTSADHQTGTDRCGEVLKSFPDTEIVVNIQGDEPLVNGHQLRQLVELFSIESVEIATLGTFNISKEEVNDPNRIKLVRDNIGNALYFSRSPLPYFRNPTDVVQPIKHIGLYGFRAATLKKVVQLTPEPLEIVESLEQLRWLVNGYKIRVGITDIETPNIDVPEDVQKVLDLIP